MINWLTLVAFLLGAIAGLIAMYYMTGDQIEIKVRKIKNKRTAGDNSVTIPISVDKPLSRRKQRKFDRLRKKQ